jgi:hypothetical protein
VSQPFFQLPNSDPGQPPATGQPPGQPNQAAPGGRPVNGGQTSPDSGNTSGPALPRISLPTGGGAIRGIDEKLTTGQPTGAASLAVPIPVSPGRQGFTPGLELRYDSGTGNGPFGLGWMLSVPSVTRKTSSGLPRYQDADDSDVFVLSSAEDLVPALQQSAGGWLPDTYTATVGQATYAVRRYRPRVEAAFTRIERWQDSSTGDVHWRTVSASNVTSLYGQDASSRISDPADPKACNAFDLDTITDVAIKLSYTARYGGDLLRSQAFTAATLPALPTQTQAATIPAAPKQADRDRLFSVKHEFPTGWYGLLNPSSSTAAYGQMPLWISQDRFPFQYQGMKITTADIEVFALLSTGATMTSLTVYLTQAPWPPPANPPVPPTPPTPDPTTDGVSLTVQPAYGTNALYGVKAPPSPSDVPQLWWLSVAAADTADVAAQVEDFFVMFHYSVA